MREVRATNYRLSACRSRIPYTVGSRDFNLQNNKLTNWGSQIPCPNTYDYVLYHRIRPKGSQYGGSRYSPASRRGRDKRGFHWRATHPPHVAIVCFQWAQVVTFGNAFVTFCHEHWLRGIAWLLWQPCLSWPRPEAVKIRAKQPLENCSTPALVGWLFACYLSLWMNGWMDGWMDG